MVDSKQLTTASELASRRGARPIGNDDLFFQIRHSPARLARLRSCIKWKAARKGLKDDDDAAAVDDVDLEELSEEAKAEKLRLPDAPLPWDIGSLYSQKPPAEDPADGGSGDGDEEGQDYGLERKRQYDEATRDMTVEEYAIFSEYRHASFTYRKAKRFREWSGLGLTVGYKKNEDVPEILGFLGSEMVQSLTTAALQLQRQELSVRAQVAVDAKKPDHAAAAALGGPFQIATQTRGPVEPRHVREAFRRMQRTPTRRRAMLSKTRQPLRTELILVSANVTWSDPKIR